MSTVISVENLSKTYRLGQIGTGTFSHDIEVWWARMRGKPNPMLRIGEKDHGNRDGEELWALRDVSFTVEQGEVLGIIGRNGAGKSTLLKILSRVTAPTSGKIKVKGRIASLLEVGTGFHPELTGRENIYLNGAILGMARQKIARKFDEIVDFAEVEKFIDTPVKRYSSGMYVRLAFAVAAHLDPEILVVDEVLAVGDADFQKKCLGKMENVAKGGRTVLFVSHNMSSIQALTTRCVFLSKGAINLIGNSEMIIEHYLGEMTNQDYSNLNLENYHRKNIRNSEVIFKRVWVNQVGNELSLINVGDEFTIYAEIESSIQIRDAHWGIALRKRNGSTVMVMLSIDHGYRLNLKPGTHVLKSTISDLPLSPGDYFIDVGVNQSLGGQAWDVILDYPAFRVVDQVGNIQIWTDRPWGVIHWNKIKWA